MVAVATVVAARKQQWQGQWRIEMAFNGGGGGSI